MQTILARRKAELELDARPRRGDRFRRTPTRPRSRSAPRSRSRTPPPARQLVYTILGAWDSDLSKGIISYQTAVARALLNHTVGEQIELSTEEGGIRHVVIEKIEPHEVDLSIPA